MASSNGNDEQMITQTTIGVDKTVLDSVNRKVDELDVKSANIAVKNLVQIHDQLPDDMKAIDLKRVLESDVRRIPDDAETIADVVEYLK